MKVSIITPSFNRADIVHETAESIFKQTYANWEWVIVEDGSTDNSWEMLQSYAAKDSRVKLFKRDRQPKGAASCRNIAVEKCNGDYLIFLDTDDILSSFCLTQRVAAMQKNQECDFIFFPMLLFSKQPDDMKLLWNIENDLDDMSRLLLGDPVAPGTGTMWKKESFVKIGGWKEDLLMWQDIELHLRAMLKGLKHVTRLDLVPDIFIRTDAKSISRAGYHSLPKLNSRISIFITVTDELARQQKIKRYRTAVRDMARRLLLNAIQSNFFDEAGKLLSVCMKHEILLPAEAKVFTQYTFTRRTRLTKIPFIEKAQIKRISSMIPSTPSVLGKVRYDKAIVL